MGLLNYANKVQANVNAGVPDINKVKADDMNEIKNAMNTYVQGGWYPLDGTIAYASADSSSFNLSTSVDLTTVLSKGMKVLLQQAQALTAYWNLDANSQSQVGSFNGTDTAMTYTTGKFGNAGTFNGTTSKIVLTDTALLKPTGAFTVGCWFKSAYTATTQVIFSSFSANANRAGFFLFTDPVTGNVQVDICNNTTTDPTSIQSGVPVCDNAWHYIVVTYQNNYAQIYIDGKLTIGAYKVPPVYASTNYVRIGCRSTNGTDALFANGQIDDLFLINGYALDEETILAKYRAQTAQGTGSITIDKKGFVTDITATTIKIYCGTDFAIANTTISNPKFAIMKNPLNFNANPDKWTIKTEITSNYYVASPSNAVYYGATPLPIYVPVGLWELSYQVGVQLTATVSQYCSANLSTSNTILENNGGFTDNQSLPVAGLIAKRFRASKIVNLNTAKWYYFMFKNDTAYTALYITGSPTSTSSVQAVCAYL